MHHKLRKLQVLVVHGELEVEPGIFHPHECILSKWARVHTILYSMVLRLRFNDPIFDLDYQTDKDFLR